MPDYPAGANWDNAGTAAYKTALSYTRHGGGDGYSDAAGSTPLTLTQVYGFLDDSFFEMGGLLTANGYATAQTNVGVRGVLQSLQGINAAIKIELALPTSSLSDEGNDRFLALQAARDRLEALITGKGLAGLGATVTTARGAYVAATGVSRDRKQDAYQDSDYVQARFRRGFGQTPGLGGEPLAIEPALE